MPQWIHDRAEHLLAKNPSMPKSQAFAVATQQAHRLGKTPKGFGTAEGKRTAKAKYTRPKREYERRSNPGKLESPKMASIDPYYFMLEELSKLSFTESEYSGGTTEGRPFIYRSQQFQSGLPQAKMGGPYPERQPTESDPNPEEQEGDRQHYPAKDEKRAFLWKAAHFACSAIGSWQEKNQR